MVYINEKEFKLYDLDTVDTILTRIAADNNTLVKFLYLPGGIPTLKEFKTKEVVVNIENLLDTIKNSKDFNDLANNIIEKLDQQKLSINEIIKLFIIYNKSIDDIEKSDDPEYKKLYLDYTLGEIEKSVIKKTGNKVNIQDILINKITNINEYNILISENKKKTLEIVQDFENFNSIHGIPYSKFELKTINFEVELNIGDLSLLEIFNNIQLTDFVPFASAFTFYKIRKEFVPPIEWNISNNNITLKVLQKEIPQYRESDYVNVVIDKVEDQTKVLLTYSKVNNISEKELIHRIINIFNIPQSNVTDIKEKSLNGVLYFPNQRVNKYILSDLIMNDSEFSKFMCIDETVIAQKQTMYIHFYTEDTGELKIYITEKIANKKDISIRDKPEFIENSYYVRVKINEAKDLKSIEKFQDIMSKLFIKYNQKYESILEFYTLFIDIDEMVTKLVIPSNLQNKKKKKTLSDIAPELFPPNYTKFCGQPPVIINDEDEEEEIRKGRVVLTFPKDIAEGSIPRKYICERRKYPYPGLRENNLSNSDKFKYLPCCLETPQTEKAAYRNYYYGEEIIESVVEQHIITSDRFVNNKQNGLLPQGILQFFNTIERNKDYEYYRQGALKTKNTFISCVLTALKLLKDDTEEFVNKTRLDFATIDLASSCKQEMYDYTIQDILNKIKDLEEYFNPDFFIHLLEVKYNCNIFLFKRDAENPEGILHIPRHIKGYFKTRVKFDKCIFIYEHNGIESDNAKYTQCELIFRWDKNGKKDDLEYTFDYDSYVTNKAFDIFGNFVKFNILRKEIKYTEFTDFIKPTSQVIDFYGKTRMVNTYIEGTLVSIFTSPMQPFGVPEEIEYKVYKVTEDTANKIVSNFPFYNKAISNNILSGTVGNVAISIPLVNSDINNYESNNKSEIREYNKYKKFSRYITQYFYWIYSKYLENNKITEEAPDHFESFKKSSIYIDENFEYPSYIPKNFSIKSAIFRGNKLVLKSEETFDRLLYLLKIESIRNQDKIIMFKDRLSIENYFMEISDFDIYSSQVILKGTSSIEKFITSNLQYDIQYKLYDVILRTSISPYFFKNSLVDNNVYLAQNTISIKKALEIYKIWTIKHYNPLYNPQESNEDYGFIFYAYTNNNNIKPYYVKGEVKSKKLIRILGFKIFSMYEDSEGVEREVEKKLYTVLLPLK